MEEVNVTPPDDNALHSCKKYQFKRKIGHTCTKEELQGLLHSKVQEQGQHARSNSRNHSSPYTHRQATYQCEAVKTIPNALNAIRAKRVVKVY
jgi:hypothetical protein